MSVTKAKEVLSICADLGEGIPVSYAQAFLEIAGDPGLSITSLALRLGMPLSTVSRAVLALSDRTKYGLVHVEYASDEKRRKVIMLTEKGRKAAARF